jgi:hypothetical protein
VDTPLIHDATDYALLVELGDEPLTGVLTLDLTGDANVLSAHDLDVLAQAHLDALDALAATPTEPSALRQVVSR